MHLDRMLKALKVASLASVLDAEMDGFVGGDRLYEQTPKALIHAVSALTSSTDRRSQRSLKMLKVLSVLPYGETLETLSHFIPAEPFFHLNAIQLHELALLDVLHLQKAMPALDTRRTVTGESSAPKLLKVPRQVRDYVLSIMSDEEREGIALAGMSRLFGRNWRDGTVKLRRLPVEYKAYLSNGVGNEYALLHNLIAQSKGRRSRTEQGAALALQYGMHDKSARSVYLLTKSSVRSAGEPPWRMVG